MDTGVRLAVSNIAWSAAEDATIATRLVAAGADALEAAPGRLHPDPADVAEDEARDLRDLWQTRGLPIVSMQALLFGRPDLLLLGNPDEQEGLISHLSAIMSFAGRLGAGPLVFGSPQNRKKGALSFDEACKNARPVFRRLGDAAQSNGTVLCIEANAVDYGCDFITTLDQAARMVTETDHPSVGLIVDTGNMAMAGELAQDALRHVHLVRHLHLSRAQLGPLDVGDDFPRRVMDGLRQAGYDGTATIEMRPVEDDPLGALERAVQRARSWIDT